MTSSTRSAVVVGGGVAGLATGLVLQRGGWDVRVRERAGVLERGGAGLVLWPNALRCLRLLGVHDEVRARATVLRESRVVRSNGRVLSRVGLATRDEDGALGVLRADLVAALAGALDPGVLELGRHVGDPAEVDADLVVGADGVHSAVRTALWPAALPVHRGSTVWRAVLDRDDHGPESVPGLTETWGRGVRFGTVPVGIATTYVYAVAPTPGRHAAADAGDDAAGDAARLLALFGGWHAPIPALLDRLEPGSLMRHDIHDLRPGGTPLHRGRRVLVGDAAHAMEPNLGQGACLALEDAVVLAHALATSASTEGGLATYAAARSGRVASLARRSRQVGRLARHAHPWGTSLRDAAMLVTPDWCGSLMMRGPATWQPPGPVLNRPGSP